MVTITKKMAGQWLADVLQDKVFWCYDGRTLKNLAELQAAFEEMSEDSFRYHSNDVKSDFSSWVKDVIGDEKLAADLKQSQTLAQAAQAVSRRVASLKRKAGTT